MKFQKLTSYLPTIAAVLSLSLPFASCYDSKDFTKDISEPVVMEDISIPLTAMENNLEDRLKSLTNQQGQPVFSEQDVSVLIKQGIPFDYAHQLSLAGFDARKIYLFNLLGLETDEILSFNDTKKPNAVIIFPVYDPIFDIFPNFSIFKKVPAFVENSLTISLFKEIKKSYDSFVRIAGEKEEVYTALQAVPDIELFILAGHGSKTSLYLQGDENGLSSEKIPERYFISIEDLELESYLSNLTPNATIFLFSCLNASGGKDADNLANFFIKAGKGRTLYAGMELYSISTIKVNTIYPFKLNSIKNVWGNDILYTNAP